MQILFRIRNISASNPSAAPTVQILTYTGQIKFFNVKGPIYWIKNTVKTVKKLNIITN